MTRAEIEAECDRWLKECQSMERPVSPQECRLGCCANTLDAVSQLPENRPNPGVRQGRGHSKEYRKIIPRASRVLQSFRTMLRQFARGLCLGKAGKFRDSNGHLSVRSTPRAACAPRLGTGSGMTGEPPYKDDVADLKRFFESLDLLRISDTSRIRSKL